MNFSDNNGADTQFQIAPMLDIVFILLLGFLASYAVSEEEKMLDVKLPESGAAKDTARKLQEIVVNVNTEGEIFVNRRKLELSDLERRLKQLMAFSKTLENPEENEPGVIIRAHADCPHKYVVAVMDVCSKVEIRRVFFAALGERKSE